MEEYKRDRDHTIRSLKQVSMLSKMYAVHSGIED